jgi:pilus assembly protein CpaF
MMMPTSDDQRTIDLVHQSLWDESDSSVPTADDERIDRRIRELIAASEPLASDARIEQLSVEVRARIDGLGALQRHTFDSSVTEIMVNGDGTVWVERRGALERTDQHLEPGEVEHLVRRLAASVGRRVDLTHPSVDLRLADGSRLHAIIPPLAVDGPCITIRRFAAKVMAINEMAPPEMCNHLRTAIRDGKTIIIAGATSSGKTTMLNALGAEIEPDSRIVTIEDAAELRLPGRHVVRLETRNATEGTAAVGLRELARHALRMRPDRIICGEMRGAEALDLVQAMNTGHRGSLSTIHANSPSDAMRRIETLMLLGDADLPLAAIREQLASCIDMVVMMSRASEGSRRVVEIANVPDRPTSGWSLDTVFGAEGSRS